MQIAANSRTITILDIPGQERFTTDHKVRVIKLVRALFSALFDNDSLRDAKEFVEGSPMFYDPSEQAKVDAFRRILSDALYLYQ